MTALAYLSSVQPAVVADDGGTRLVFAGAFDIVERYAVSILVGDGEVVCYSGTSGEGNLASPDSATQLTAVMPPLPKGGAYSVRLRDEAGAQLGGDLVGALTVENRSFHARSIAIRSVFPPPLAVGPLILVNTDELARVDALENQAPTFDAIPDFNLVEGVPWSYTPTGYTDPDAGPGPTTWIPINVPAWVTVDPATGEMSGTPTQGTLTGLCIGVNDGQVTTASNPFSTFVAASLPTALVALAAGGSTVSAVVTPNRPLEAAPVETSTVAATMGIGQGVLASSVSVSSAAATLALDVALQAAPVSASVVAAILGAEIPVAATVTATSVVTATALSTGNPLAALVAGASTASAALSLELALGASPVSTSTASGLLSNASLDMAASSDAVSTVAGDLSLELAAAAVVAASSTAAATMTLGGGISASPASVSSASASLDRDREVAAAPAQASSVSADLKLGAVMVAAPAQASSASASLDRDREVAAASAAVSTAAADMAREVSISAAVAATSTASAAVQLFLPAAAPGSPFVDYNAESHAAGALTTWTNDGSDATGDLDSNPGAANNPQVIAGTDGPVADAKYVEFDISNTEALTGSLTTNKTGEIVFAAVMRWTGAVGGSFEYVFDGEDATHRNRLWRETTGSPNYSGWGTHGGIINNSKSSVERDKWVRVVGKFSTNEAVLSVERVWRIGRGFSSGGNDLHGITVGSAYNGALFANMDLARLVMWSDGTTPLEAERWLEEEYYFAAVPPGNPGDWYDPNDYAVGSLSSVTDKGLLGFDLTGSSMTIALDADCPEQKVFVFNGTNGYLYVPVDDNYSLTGSNYLVAASIRKDVTGTTFALGHPSGTTFICGIASGNEVIRRNSGAERAGPDLDTVAPFNTWDRWTSIQWRFAATTSNGSSYVDGVEGAIADEGSADVTRLEIGRYTSGSTFWFDGRVGDIIIYSGSDENRPERAAEVEQWLQRHRRLSTVPGAPAVDLNTASFSAADGDDVSTWTNDGSLTDWTQTGAARPTFRSADNPPDPGVAGSPGWLESVEFDPTNSEYLKSGADSEIGSGGLAIVYRPDTIPTSGNKQWLTSSNVAIRERETWIWNNFGNKRIYFAAGGSPSALFLPAPLAGDWASLAAQVENADFSMRDERDNFDSLGTGTEEGWGTIKYLGTNISLADFFDGRVARLVAWGDGTTQEEIEEWLARRYPGLNPYG